MHDLCSQIETLAQLSDARNLDCTAKLESYYDEFVSSRASYEVREALCEELSEVSLNTQVVFSHWMQGGSCSQLESVLEHERQIWQKLVEDEGVSLTHEMHELSKMLVRQLTVVLTWERKERSLQLEKLVRRIEVERAGCNAKLDEHHALITELMLSCMGHAPPNGVDNSRCGDGVQQAHKAETRKLGFDLNDRLTREISDRYLQIDVLMHQLEEECEKQNMNSDQHHASEHEPHVNQEFARGDAEESAECFNSVQDAYAMLLRDVSNVMTKWNASQEAFTQECASANCGPAHSTSEGSLAMKTDTVRWMRELEQRVEEVCAAASKNTR